MPRKRKRGRPKKPKAERRLARLEVRLSLEEHSRLAEKAERAGYSLSEYVRKMLLE